MEVNVELVQQLISRIDEEGTIPYRYVAKMDDKYCYCAVGHAVCVTGERDLVADYELSQTDSELLGYKFNKGMGAVEVQTALLPSLKPYGLRLIHWKALQEINDNSTDDMDRRKNKVIAYLKNLIQ